MAREIMVRLVEGGEVECTIQGHPTDVDTTLARHMGMYPGVRVIADHAGAVWRVATYRRPLVRSAP